MTVGFGAVHQASRDLHSFQSPSSRTEKRPPLGSQALRRVVGARTVTNQGLERSVMHRPRLGLTPRSVMEDSVVRLDTALLLHQGQPYTNKGAPPHGVVGTDLPAARPQHHGGPQPHGAAPALYGAACLESLESLERRIRTAEKERDTLGQEELYLGSCLKSVPSSDSSKRGSWIPSVKIHPCRTRKWREHFGTPKYCSSSERSNGPSQRSQCGAVDHLG